MIALPETVSLPLKMDDHGVIRVSGTRVTLDTVIACYRQGDMPEDLHTGFPSVPLSDIYAVISYYLSHQTEVDEYLRRGEQIADNIRAEWERRVPAPTRRELQKRLTDKRRGQ